MKSWGNAEMVAAVLAAALLSGWGGLLCAETIRGRAETVAVRGASTPAQEAVLREIRDPHLGVRWLLMADAEHPGGPGHLVAVDAKKIAAGGAHKEAAAEELPVIHTGDALVVEQHSAAVDARFEATALSPGRTGGPLQVRLKIGGKVLRAIAVAPGKATLEGEARR